MSWLNFGAYRRGRLYYTDLDGGVNVANLNGTSSQLLANTSVGPDGEVNGKLGI